MMHWIVQSTSTPKCCEITDLYILTLKLARYNLCFQVLAYSEPFSSSFTIHTKAPHELNFVCI